MAWMNTRKRSASVLLSTSPDFLSHRTRTRLVGFLGSMDIILDAPMKKIRKHLDRHYCRVCGEYMFPLFRDRDMRHIHILKYRTRYIPLANQRLNFHHRLGLVEWERRFPRVMRLPTVNTEAGRSHRIPALRLWTLIEWNMLYPHLRNKYSKRIATISSVFIPNMLSIQQSDLSNVSKIETMM